jgi:hypothetical protein
MSTMTFRARDSVTALELVQRRLGPDALILSNDLIDGQVVIVASDDEPESIARPAPRLRAVPTPQRVDVVIDDPIDPITPPAPAVSAPAARLPSFLSAQAPKPFDRMLGEAKATTPAPAPQSAEPQTPETPEPPAPTPAPARVSALPDPLLLRDRLLSSPRIVLLGPVGAGKSQVALQLALLRLARNPGSRVEFCFCGTGSHGDGAFLAQKSHLLGMTTLFHTPDTLAAPVPGTVQIVVISGRGSDGPALARAALVLPEARAALVVPCGLRAARVDALHRRWAEHTISAILPEAEGMPEGITDQETLRAAGFVPLWTASNDRLVDGLRVIEDEAAEATAPAPADPTGQPMLFRHHGPDAESRS